MGLDFAEADRLGKQLERVFSSPNEEDRNGEQANVVDGLFAIARGLHDLADAVRDRGNSGMALTELTEQVKRGADALHNRNDRGF